MLSVEWLPSDWGFHGYGMSTSTKSLSGQAWALTRSCMLLLHNCIAVSELGTMPRCGCDLGSTLSGLTLNDLSPTNTSCFLFCEWVFLFRPWERELQSLMESWSSFSRPQNASKGDKYGLLRFIINQASTFPSKHKISHVWVSEG